MQAALLAFALVWQSVAPLCITPGMIRQQVEKILGKPDGNIGLGPFGKCTTTIYRRYPGLFLAYGPDDRVEKVEYSAFRKI